MPEGFEAEVLTALKGLREGQNALRAEVAGLREDVHRIDAALALVRADVAAAREELGDLRGEVVVATTLAAGAETRADATRELLREVIKTQAAHGRRLGRLEERGREGA